MGRLKFPIGVFLTKPLKGILGSVAGDTQLALTGVILTTVAVPLRHHQINKLSGKLYH